MSYGHVLEGVTTGEPWPGSRGHQESQYCNAVEDNATTVAKPCGYMNVQQVKLCTIDELDAM